MDRHDVEEDQEGKHAQGSSYGMQLCPLRKELSRRVGSFIQRRIEELSVGWHDDDQRKWDDQHQQKTANQPPHIVASQPYQQGSEEPQYSQRSLHDRCAPVAGCKFCGRQLSSAFHSGGMLYQIDV